MRNCRRAVTTLMSLAAGSLASFSVVDACPPPLPTEATPPPIVDPVGAPVGDVAAAPNAAKRRVELERELKHLRFEYFRTRRNVETRQVGIDKVRQYTDPSVFPVLLEILGKEDADVQDALADHFADQKTDQGDAALAWAAVFAPEQHMREAAERRLMERVSEAGAASNRVQWAVAAGLKSSKEREANAAAHLADNLNLVQAIPSMINAQVTGGGGGGGGAGGGERDRQGSLGFIMVATQTAFVSDLEPVVGDSAVAFDPELSVVTDGTVLRVMDAAVVTYRTEIHQSLVALSTRAWGGQSTASLGWDQKAWNRWYREQFLPYHRQQEEMARSADSAAPAAPEPTAARSPSPQPGVSPRN